MVEMKQQTAYCVSCLGPLVAYSQNIPEPAFHIQKKKKMSSTLGACHCAVTQFSKFVVILDPHPCHRSSAVLNLAYTAALYARFAPSFCTTFASNRFSARFIRHLPSYITRTALFSCSTCFHKWGGRNGTCTKSVQSVKGSDLNYHFL